MDLEEFQTVSLLSLHKEEHQWPGSLRVLPGVLDLVSKKSAYPTGWKKRKCCPICLITMNSPVFLTCQLRIQICKFWRYNTNPSLKMAGNWGSESWRSHPKSRELVNIRDRPESTGIIIVSSYPFLSIYCVLATVICTYISVTILILMPQNWRLLFPCFCLKSESLTNLYLVSATVW